MRIDAVVSAGAAATALMAPDVTVGYLGVPVNVLVACAAGAYSSFCFGERVRGRGRMFSLFLACIIMGAAFTAIFKATVIHVAGMEVSSGLEAAMGCVVSCLTRFWIPTIIEVIRSKEWVNWIPFLKGK